MLDYIKAGPVVQLHEDAVQGAARYAGAPRQGRQVAHCLRERGSCQDSALCTQVLLRKFYRFC